MGTRRNQDKSSSGLFCHHGWPISASTGFPPGLGLLWPPAAGFEIGKWPDLLRYLTVLPRLFIFMGLDGLCPPPHIGVLPAEALSVGAGD